MKYVLTNETKKVIGTKLYRIKAIKDFGVIKKETLGGWIENEKNLSQYGNAWVYGNARVFGNAEVYGNAWVSENARVSGNVEVSGNAEVYGNAWVSENARVSGNADYCCFQCFGSENRTTTIMKSSQGVIVKCGCFEGSLEDFTRQVEKTHANNKYGKEYNAMIELVKIKFNLEG